ncbi:hypothetical protein DRJ17_03580 [Candidatus Woesearchaeota archaeon]|nr:MAG: hypothetical protein DRJ17_03580 [Candidatus Woesearchaeota archaeon]
MKQELPALELHYIIKELQILIGAKVDQIYQPDKKDIYIQFHKTGAGRLILRITPNFVYLSSAKQSSPQPPGFCRFLRKYLKNARVNEIKQIDFERIIQITFSTKEKNYIMIIELIPPGNVILCETDFTIRSPLETQSWKDRTIRGGIRYSYPKLKCNTLTLTKDKLEQIIKESKRDSIVKTLAIDLALGGTYAEELLLISKIKKDKKHLSNNDVSSIYDAIRKIKNKEINAQIVKQNNRVKDITPFKLKLYKNFKQEPQESFNKALDTVLTEVQEKKREKKQLTTQEKEIKKQEKIIKLQQKKLEELQLALKENIKKGDLLYQNFNLVQDIIYQINEACKSLSWQEIKKKLKNHKILKEINEKEKTITLEL